MGMSERRIDLERAIMDVFLFAGKTETEQFNALSRVCELIGTDPTNQTDRTNALSAIMACRRGSYEREMPLIRKLVRNWIPSMWDPFLDLFR